MICFAHQAHDLADTVKSKIATAFSDIYKIVCPAEISSLLSDRKHFVFGTLMDKTHAGTVCRTDHKIRELFFKINKIFFIICM